MWALPEKQKLNYRLPGKGQEEEDSVQRGPEKLRLIVCVDCGLDYKVACVVKCVQSEQILIYVKYISITLGGKRELRC